jgi:selenide,water dikinase
MPAIDPRLLVGPETLDDAAALKVSDELAMCFTADFITPVVDDPWQWGRIAAANAISDIYAMGAKPLAALNLVCWPSCLPLESLSELLAGGGSAAADSDCLIVGGHTIEDKEPKYGLAVIGVVHPDQIIRNQGAQPGDLIYLTKTLGTGVIATAMKADMSTEAELNAATRSMTTVNRGASEAAVAAGARAMTDVSGFGLAGHLSEMLGLDSGIGARISLAALPILPGALGHMDMGLIPAGAYRNRDAYQQRLEFANDQLQAKEMLLYDPQTSGGLLAAIPAEATATFEHELARRRIPACRIGEFEDGDRIRVV